MLILNQTFLTKQFQHLDLNKGVHLLKQAESPGIPPPNCQHQILSLYWEIFWPNYSLKWTENIHNVV